MREKFGEIFWRLYVVTDYIRYCQTMLAVLGILIHVLSCGYESAKHKHVYGYSIILR